MKKAITLYIVAAVMVIIGIMITATTPEQPKAADGIAATNNYLQWQIDKNKRVRTRSMVIGGAIVVAIVGTVVLVKSKKTSTNSKV